MCAQPSPTGNRPPKQLSSRLMTMKFMQRATVSPTSPSTPSPRSKRLKTSHSSDGPLPNGAGQSPVSPEFNESPAHATQSNQSPAYHSKPDQPQAYPSGPTNPTRTPAFPSAPTDSTGAQLLDADLRAAAQQALIDEENRRQTALLRNDTASQETRWVLSLEEEEKTPKTNGTGLRVVRWGEEDDEGDDGEINEENETPWRAGDSWGGGSGRMRFGQWKVKEQSETQQDDDQSSRSESGSDSDSQTSSGESKALPKQALDRISSNAAANREKHKRKSDAETFRDHKARKTDANKYGALQSISSGGGGAGPPNKRKPEKSCFRCGQPGHIKADCPDR